MMDKEQKPGAVAVIGAGPAGLYAARQLASEGLEVVLLNRDIKPGGLAEYGIYYDKYKMKEGLRKQFRQILAIPNIHYIGNVVVGQDGDITLEELHELGFQAMMVTVGAQGTKWLGLPGEDLKGVYHAKDLVYHYNKLPPFSTQEFAVHGRVALIGVGNVMMDIAHWAIRDLKVDEAIAVARRGPAEVKFSKKEMEAVARNLDLEALDAELERVRPIMEAIGQDVQTAKAYILSGLPKAMEPTSSTRFRFDFLASPTRIVGDETGKVIGLEVENTTLVPKNGDTKARSLGTRRILDVDTVVFCIGDRVDDRFGLPVQWNEFVKNPSPRFPVDGISYEAYDQETGKPLEGVFMAGWSREASSGLVGVARKDGENGAKALLQYLQTLPSSGDPKPVFDTLNQLLSRSGKRLISKEDVACLEAYESKEAERLGLDEIKLKSNEEMLKIIEG
ncbi:MAG TPA: FAD-dependent oxidoreductase [Anaerolineales bacterium]|nr:FAD-dependent oxidoreductase [Anaerolineales bacterium]